MRIALLLMCASIAVRAQECAVQIPEPPISYTPLRLTFTDGKVIDGYWFVPEQVVRIDARINYLENRCTKECVDAAISTKPTLAFWIVFGAGVIVGGFAGFFLARR